MALIILVCGLYPGVYSHFINPTETFHCQEISSSQADELQALIKQVATQKGVHPNKIHIELKKKFNYSSYRKMDCSTWEKVKELLKLNI